MLISDFRFQDVNEPISLVYTGNKQIEDNKCLYIADIVYKNIRVDIPIISVSQIDGRFVYKLDATCLIQTSKIDPSILQNFSVIKIGSHTLVCLLVCEQNKTQFVVPTSK